VRDQGGKSQYFPLAVSHHTFLIFIDHPQAEKIIDALAVELLETYQLQKGNISLLLSICIISDPCPPLTLG